MGDLDGREKLWHSDRGEQGNPSWRPPVPALQLLVIARLAVLSLIWIRSHFLVSDPGRQEKSFQAACAIVGALRPYSGHSRLDETHS